MALFLDSRCISSFHLVKTLASLVTVEHWLLGSMLKRQISQIQKDYLTNILWVLRKVICLFKIRKAEATSAVGIQNYIATNSGNTCWIKRSVWLPQPFRTWASVPGQWPCGAIHRSTTLARKYAWSETYFC